MFRNASLLIRAVTGNQVKFAALLLEHGADVAVKGKNGKTLLLAGAREMMDQAMSAVEGEALAAGGAENHLHILVRLSPDHTVQEALDTLRSRLDAWVAESRGKGDSRWKDSEVAVTISPDELGTAREFIERQAAHHEVVTFQTELKAIFDEHGFDYDPRELWGYRSL